MAEVIGVRFKEVGKVYYFDPLDNKLNKGDMVIVETARGLECGEVATPNKTIDETELAHPLKPLIRIANEADLNHLAENKLKEKEAYRICEQKIANHKLEMKLVNAEWTLTYDTSKLQLDTARSNDFMPEVANEVTNIMENKGTVKSNFTDISNLKDFTTQKTFARAYFKVIGTGDATVELKVNTLSVGYLDSNFKINFEPVVRNGVKQNVTSKPGYEKFTSNVNTKAYEDGGIDFILGDVTGDGIVDVNDVTAIQLYLTENISFTDAQKLAADTNQDGKISVLDVTRTQEMVAGYTIK